MDKAIDYISWTILAISMLLLKMTSRYVENIIFGKLFVWQNFLIGLAILLSWTFLLYKFRRNYYTRYENGEKRASAVLSQFFSIIILTIFLNAFYTYHTGKEDIYYKDAILVSKASNLKTGTDYIHVLIDGRKERFNPNNAEYKSLNRGDTLMLKIGTGKTGYDIIYQFKKK